MRGLAAHAGYCPNKGLQVRALLAHYCAMMAATNDSRGRPYSDEEWQEILAAGDAVDARLKAGDVRLSMGGEPTFVALDDSQAPEWNIAALGPTKRDYADKLARRLRERFAPGGLLHYGQGKWYPGEQRRAGRSPSTGAATASRSGSDPALIAEETPTRAGNDRRCRDASPPSSAAALGLPPRAPLPPTRTAAHFVLVEQKLPLGVAPEDNKLADPAERKRLMRVFEHGLDTPAGFVLPLLMRGDGAGRRRFVTRALGLPARPPVPAAGRLADRPAPAARQPARDRLRRLSQRAAGRSLRRARASSRRARLLRRHGADAAARRGSSRGGAGAHGAGHRAARRPPVRLPAAARRRPRTMPRWSPPSRRPPPTTGRPCAWKATRRPYDPRLSIIKVTPDPGVIEVNVHPAAVLGRTRSTSPPPSTRRRAADRPRRREVHARRPPCRHRRRQPHRARRPHAGRQPVPAPARPARQHHRLLAEPSLAVLPVRGPVRRADQPGAARRRGAPRLALRAGDRARADPRAAAAPLRRGWSTACSATCWSTSPAIRTAPRSASTSCMRRRGRWAASAWSSSAPSRCRRMRA